VSDPIYFAPIRTRFVDERTGLMAREWYLFFQALWLRSGGALSNDDLAISISQGLGFGEIQAQQISEDQALAQIPPGNPITVAENLEWMTAQLAFFQSQLAEILKQLQDIKLAVNTGN
jgi:hypothetical protein